MRRRIRGIFLIILGLVMSISAAGIFAVYEYQAEIAGDNARLLLDGLCEEMQNLQQAEVFQPENLEQPTTELPQLTLSGYDLVGVVRAPSLGLELPVLNEWSYDLLQISPCRYSGSAEAGDLILLGHNYKKHFTPLKKLAVGDPVEFVDVTGKAYIYEVGATEILQKTELERLTGTDYDLTLFTCTNGGYSRFVVRCEYLYAEERDAHTLAIGTI